VWATRKEQGRNKSTNRHIIYKDTKYILADLAELSGVSAAVLALRLNNGWTPEQAVEIPLYRNQDGTSKEAQYLYRHEMLTLTDMSRCSGISVETLRGRLQMGWSVEKTVETPLFVNEYLGAGRTKPAKPLTGREHPCRPITESEDSLLDDILSSF